MNSQKETSLRDAAENHRNNITLGIAEITIGPVLAAGGGYLLEQAFKTPHTQEVLHVLEGSAEFIAGIIGSSVGLAALINGVSRTIYHKTMLQGVAHEFYATMPIAEQKIVKRRIAKKHPQRSIS